MCIEPTFLCIKRTSLHNETLMVTILCKEVTNGWIEVTGYRFIKLIGYGFNEEE